MWCGLAEAAIDLVGYVESQRRLRDILSHI